MFEAAEPGHAIDQDTSLREEPTLRADLLKAQYDLKQNASFPVIARIAERDGADKGERVHQRNGWLDPRLNETRAFAEPTDEERERPRLWRHWKVQPPRGWQTEFVLLNVPSVKVANSERSS
jgi:AMP-polyphosphate phosphotransferase